MQHRHLPRHAAFAFATAALALAACSENSGDSLTDVDAAASGRSESGHQHSMKEGALYVAQLHPLNARIQQQMDPDPRTPTGVTTGTAYFRVIDGNLRAIVDVAGAEPTDGEPFPEGLHPQHIHEADRCPSMSADTNGDGILDVIEGVPFYGPIMVPLDSDLADTSSQIPGFPLATGRRGTYYYDETASVSSIEAALGHALELPKRHVVIHGVDLDTPLPASVQTIGTIPAQLTLPVACGEIREVR